MAYESENDPRYVDFNARPGFQSPSTRSAVYVVDERLGETHDGLAWLYAIRELQTGKQHLLYSPKEHVNGGWAFRLLLLDEVQ